MKMNDTLRTIIWILIIVIVTAFGISRIKKMKTEIKPKSKIEAIKNVSTRAVVLGDNKAEVLFSGKIVAFDRIELFAEVNGLFLSQNFKEGNRFAKGQSLVQIESAEIENNLKAQKSNLLSQVSSIMGDLSIDFPEEKNKWSTFLSKINVEKALPPLPEISQKLKVYLAGKSILNTYYSILSQEERLKKYAIRAPFNGVVSATNLKQGTLVRAGQKLGEFIGTNVFDLEAEFSLVDKKMVNIGDVVSFSSADLNKTWKGTIYRINPSVNSTSQMVTAYIKLTGSDLKEGMFLQGYIQGETYPNSFVVDRKFITDGHIYTIQSDSLVLKPVQTLSYKGNQAIISGLENGDTVLKELANGLYPGLKVRKSSPSK